MFVKVRQGQSIFDIALQYYGSIEAVQWLITDNNIDLNASLEVGRQLTIRNEVYNQAVVDYFKNKTITSNV